MTSEISIVRKFLSLYLDNKIQRIRIKLGTYDFQLGKSVDRGYLFGSFLEIKDDILSVKTWKRTSEVHIEIFKDYIDVSDIQEFLDSDDTLLILKYGRSIKDEDIIQCLNIGNLYGGISYNDFNEYFNL